MAELRPIPLSDLVHRVLREPALQQSLFDLPLRKCWTPSSPSGPAGAPDLSVALHGHRAQTPVGPAAGPHAQLAQNIVLAWAAGARVIELKTVQILDQLEIPRPCIDAATVGFNVEWSQELPLGESLREYVAGAMLVRMLRQLDPFGLGAAAAEAEPIFELSVGYSLEGLQQPRMREYLERVRDVTPVIAALRDELRADLLGSAAPEHRALLDLDFRADLVSCVTLSTFHGCPPAEIEAIARYLLDEHGFDVIVKLNPTLLGYDEVGHLLRDRLGYHELRPRKSAFDSDLGWEQAMAMAQRLSDHAAARGRAFGVKMTNTLVVDNHKSFFAEKEMYLSGAPLHVLAMQCVDRFRAALGPSVPLSFSGGIDAGNVVDAVACDLVPVTTCTDLLRPGGYGRLSRYLTNLEEAMVESGAPDRDELVLRRFGKASEAARQVMAALRAEAGDAAHTDARREQERLLDALEERLVAAAADRSTTLRSTIDDFGAEHAGLGAALADLPARLVSAAGALNAHEVAARVIGDPRYGAGKNGKPPRKVGTQLVLLDCLSCDKCVPVCPNDANFSLDTPLEERPFADLLLDEAGAVTSIAAAGVWRVGKPSQWANYADACNECGNCDVFCPESGGPYVMKARFFGSRASFDESAALDGILLERDATGRQLHAHARIEGRAYQLRLPDTGPAILDDGVLRVTCDRESGAPIEVEVTDGARGPHRLSGAVYLTLRTLIRGALDPARINPVSARIRSETRATA